MHYSFWRQYLLFLTHLERKITQNKAQSYELSDPMKLVKLQGKVHHRHIPKRTPSQILGVFHQSRYVTSISAAHLQEISYNALNTSEAMGNKLAANWSTFYLGFFLQPLWIYHMTWRALLKEQERGLNEYHLRTYIVLRTNLACEPKNCPEKEKINIVCCSRQQENKLLSNIVSFL